MRKTRMILILLTITTMLFACSKKGDEPMDNNLAVDTNNQVHNSDENLNLNDEQKDGENKNVKEEVDLDVVEGEDAVEDQDLVDHKDVIEEIDYTKMKLVALTFDDGPNLTTTPLVLDKLEEHGVVATFFLIGNNVNEDTKPVMERQLSLGCEIGNHSFSHTYINKLGVDDIKAEIQDTNDVINEMVGITPVLFRPPYLATNNDMYENIDLPFISGLGCNDWEASVTAKERAKTILSKVKDGDIILLHDFTGNDNTVDALDEIITGLSDEGYAFVTVSQLFEYKNIDPNIPNKFWTNTGY